MAAAKFIMASAGASPDRAFTHSVQSNIWGRTVTCWTWALIHER